MELRFEVLRSKENLRFEFFLIYGLWSIPIHIWKTYAFEIHGSMEYPLSLTVWELRFEFDGSYLLNLLPIYWKIGDFESNKKIEIWVLINHMACGRPTDMHYP